MVAGMPNSTPRRGASMQPAHRRRRWAIGGVLLFAGLLALALLPGHALAAPCSATWNNASGGAWNVPGNWLGNAVPAPTDDVCLPRLSSTPYVVTLSSGTTVNSLTVGSGSGTSPDAELLVQAGAGGSFTLTLTAASTVKSDGELALDAFSNNSTATLAGATLTNDGLVQSTLESGNHNAIEAPLVNDGQLTVASGELRQDAATTTTNDSTGTILTYPGARINLINAAAQLSNDGTVHDGGAINVISGATWTQSGGTESGDAIALSGGTLADSAGTGAFDLLNADTLSGTIAAGQTVTVEGSSNGSATTTLSGTVTNSGTLALDAGSGNTATITGGALTNDGTVQSTVESGNEDVLETALVNNSQVTVASGELLQDTATTTTNNGTFTVDSGATFDITSASGLFDNAGSLANNGTINLTSDASWTQGAGAASQSGNPVTLYNSGVLTDTSGAGSFTLIDTPVLKGTIPAGQTVTVTAPSGHNANVQLTGASVTNDGTLIFDAPASGGYAELTGSPLTNNATLRTQQEGGNQDHLQVSLTNAAGATVEVKTGTLLQDAAHTTTANSGTLTVDSGAAFDITSSTALFDNTGAVANGGTISLTSNASWTQNAGAAAQTGNPIAIYNSGTLTDTSGAGSFSLIDTPVLKGTIPAGQTVTVTAPSGHNANAQLTGGVINNGTLVLDAPASGGYAKLTGSALTNNGTLLTQQEGGNDDSVEVPLTNAAGATVEVKTGTLLQDAATTTTNNGTFTVDSGATFDITSATALFDNEAAAPGGVVNGGSLALSSNASWTQNGPQSGHPVSLYNSGTLTDESGVGSFTLIDTPILSGTIPAGQTVTVTAPSGHNGNARLSGDVTNNGTFVVDAPASGGYAKVSAAAGTPTLTNNGTLRTQVDAGAPNQTYLETSLVNSSGATVEVASGALAQDAGTTTTNNGTLITDPAGTGTTAGTLDLTAPAAVLVNDGTLTNHGAINLTGDASWTQNAHGATQAGNTVTIYNSGTLDDQTGAGSFTLIDTPLLEGTIPAGQTVTVTAPSGHNANAQLTGASVTNDGTLILDAPASGGYAELTGSPLTNNATLRTQQEGGNQDHLQVPLTNATGATVEVKTGTLLQDTSTTTTNDGTFTVDSGATFDATGGNGLFVNNATLANAGSISLTGNASWTQNAGTATQSGNPVTINNSGTLTDTSGAGSFTLIDTPVLKGTISAGQTVTVTAPSGHNANAQLTGASVTNDGTLILDAPASGGYAELTGSPLTNNATLRTQQEGGNQDHLQVPLTNATGATVEVKTGTLLQDTSTTTTNDGTFTVDSGATFDATGGNGLFVNNATLANAGSISLTGNASWTQNAGTATQSGNPVTINNSGTLTDTSGAGSFTLIDTPVLKGTISAGQTVTVTAPSGHNANAQLTGASVTNDGTLILDAPASGGYAELTGSPLTNNATLRTQQEGGNQDHLQVPLTNATTGDVDVRTGTLLQDTATTTTNDGTIEIEAGAVYAVTSAGATFTNAAAGTLQPDISSAGIGTLTLPGSTTTALDGTILPNLVGGYAPPPATRFVVITGATSGSFATVANNFLGDYSQRSSNVAVTRDRDSTAAAVTAQAGPAIYGQPVTLTATLTPGPGPFTDPTGNVTFYDGATVLGSASVATSSGLTTAALTVALPVGPHSITATYAGDANFKASLASPPATETVYEAAPAVSVAASSASITAGQSVTFTATVAGPAGAPQAPSGTVTFTDGGATLATVPLTASGTTATAAYTTTALAVGVHAIGAAYGGDDLYTPAAAATPAGVTVVAPPATTTATSVTSSTSTSTSAGGGVKAVQTKTLPKDTRIVPKGTVRVKLPDSPRYVPISSATTVPFGTTVDATSGTVQLDLTTPSGTIKGQLYGGAFVLTETKSGAVIATLTGGNFAVCPRLPAAKASLTTASAAKKAAPSTVVRKLWANVQGNFTTSGRYASASVRGTHWLTEDLCDGTFVYVAFGAVRVTADATHRSTLVKGGRSLLVRAP